ncbi:MAG TPA: DUF5060 domain-containing protein [Anaerolineales bacterium]|nr:DUF5060 domain-containing protein [Anaerolineales bacterium]
MPEEPSPTVSQALTSVPEKSSGEVVTYVAWSKVELALNGPESVGLSATLNPYIVQVEVIFTSPQGNTYVVPAFYDGDGLGGLDGNVWKARFAPDVPGEWRYASKSTEPRLEAYTGTFTVEPQSGCNEYSPGGLPDFPCTGRLEYTGEHYLRFNSGEYWLKGGVDDPENFLGKAFGDWNAKKTAVDYLASRGVNSIYLVTNNVEGDRRDTWPWVGATEEEAKANSDRFDTAKLDQWEDFFDYVQSRGILLHVILNDDSAWHGYDHNLYYREMVARFGHHPALVWNIGEEANEIYSDAEQQDLAARLQSLDPYNHPVTVHRKSSWPFLGDPNFDLTSIQPESGGANFTNHILMDYNQVVTDHRESSLAAGRLLPIMIDETPRVTKVTPATQYKMRSQVIYPIYLAGGSYELHYYDVFGMGEVSIQDLSPMLEDLWRARGFIETLPFDQMESCNQLLSGKARFCFGKRGVVYAIYFPSGGIGWVDLSAVSGSLDVNWYNPRTGESSFAGSIEAGQKQEFVTPDSEDWVLQLGDPSRAYQPYGFQAAQNQNPPANPLSGMDLGRNLKETFAFLAYLPVGLESGH